MSLLPVADAIERVRRDCAPLESENVFLPDALDRVLGQRILARRTQPGFDASSMDGYAVRFADTAQAPTALINIGEAPAGHAFDGRVEQGQCVRIFTGAPVPAGADTVIMQEHTERSGDVVTIRQAPPRQGHYIRPLGMDFTESKPLLEAGTWLGPSEIGLAAAANHTTLPVIRKPVVAILSTGDELVMPGEIARPDQIIASNGFSMSAFVRANGGRPLDLGIARDTRESIIAVAEPGLEADIFVSIGGASVGDHDIVQDVLKEMGLKVDFWRIAMRPGKPLIHGTLGHAQYLGLPGNPVSSLVCARVYLKAMLDAMLGCPPEDHGRETALVGAPLPANDERQDFLRAAFSYDETGELVATAFGKQDSSLLSVLARADCLLIRPPFAPATIPGERAHILRLNR